ncbi:peroxiredoxin [Ralstonia syzygii subsp. celebesensis]|uniref:Glutathione-dependent peroxiredoxin n=3 Tax=Ralstonia solanacearum species complex TaxID=3116862 RepID=A0AAD0S4Q6_RALSL|nr:MULTISPECIES: peroxiredoxin [Ralstonia solanacearum species complex]CCA81480.1 peroxiredoxin [blood disease bacterium R229]AQW30838.1 peroxiredoxin [blood disease bacterium A2-HR MARDI]AXV80549.1 peroxiredoxin [Ralstonia solanacearum]AXW51698.1 peroxiredoxin [Ralstonia solanacearum]QQV55350.1 peroxiredoxin [Ralstonia syzygii subsp. celebesensis]
MIQPGQPLPDATLYEYFEVEKDGCVLGPNAFSAADLVQGKTILIFGLPGAFTPTCSARHVPGYLAHYDALRAKGVDEIWCVSVNDAFVMGAWARAQGTDGRVRMLADGSAEFTRKLGLEQDLSKRGMGVRSQRYAMIVKNGVVTALQVEAPGQFAVSDAESMLARL